MGRSRLRAAALLLVAVGGCASGDDAGARPQLWTLFGLRAAQLAGATVAVTATLPQGIDPNQSLEPQADGTAALRILPAYSEGQPAAYVMPEIWASFDAVWVQPWYVLVTAWDEKNPSDNKAKTSDGMTAPPVFDVGPRSRFYSPLWLQDYVVLPEGADPALYTSAERIFDERLTVHQTSPWTYSVRPDDVVLADAPVHPYLQTPVASFLNAQPVSWVDGESMGYFNEGSNNFRYDPTTLVVEETPLYELSRRGPDGAPVPIGAPRVMGSGPPFAGRPADAPNGRPRFGAYTRLFLAVAPAAAAAFDPDAAPDAAALLTAQAIDPQSYRGRVATDGACFAKTTFPAGCTWLDSQARIEASLGATNIVRSEVSACTPLVFYGGKGIGR
jgi:hypothetical protein